VKKVELVIYAKVNANNYVAAGYTIDYMAVPKEDAESYALNGSAAVIGEGEATILIADDAAVPIAEKEVMAEKAYYAERFDQHLGKLRALPAPSTHDEVPF